MRSRGAGQHLKWRPGSSSSIRFWAILAVFGVGVLVSQINWLYEGTRIAGAVYLFFLGGRMLLSLRRPEGIMPTREPGKDTFVSLRKGLVVGLTNPKCAAFYGSLFGTFLPVQAPDWVHGLTVAIVATVVGAWFLTIAPLFSSFKVQRNYRKLQRPIDAVMGTLLIVLSVSLAYEESGIYQLP
jgi:threonine efflux protein